MQAPSMQASNFAAHERSQLATNDLDFSQGLPSKFDLRLDHADIPQRDGRNNKVINAILQTTQRRFDPNHFSISLTQGHSLKLQISSIENLNTEKLIILDLSF
jgi:hypothetical protein